MTCIQMFISGESVNCKCQCICHVVMTLLACICPPVPVADSDLKIQSSTRELCHEHPEFNCSSVCSRQSNTGFVNT